MSRVLCKLPKAGLGNQLFPLMKAYAFANLNNLPVMVTGYHQLKIGPYVRKEKTKRKYKGFFIFQKNFIAAYLDELKTKGFRGERIAEPQVAPQNCPSATSKLYIFADVPHWDHYFDGLKENRELVKQIFWNLLTSDIIKKIESLPPPCIGVHIRMGDFRKLAEGEDFSELGIVRTPERYFIEVINDLRSIHGSELPVSVFTDGFRNEFEELFNLKNIELIEGNPDIVDMVLLSKSRIIVTSASSTFSYWSAFLSDAIVILHPDHVSTSIRSINEPNLYEGAMERGDAKLQRLIKGVTTAPGESP